jgi:hypothetical protein
MAEDERKLGMSKLAVEDVKIGAADAARRDLDKDLLRPGLRHRQLCRAQRLACPIEQHGLHY